MRAEAANISRSEKQREIWAARRASGVKLDFNKPKPPKAVVKKTADVWLPAERLIGRVLIALAERPLTIDQLAKACRTTVDEIVDRAPLLRRDIEILQVGEGVLVYQRRESWERLWPARVDLLMAQIRELAREGVSRAEIARRFDLPETTVIRVTHAALRKAS